MDAVRSALQPVTQNLPSPICDLGISILGDVCYQKLIHDIDPSSSECLKLAVSKGLGIGIIAAASVVKIPQILKLINSKSSDGISFLSYLLETSSYLISLAYNYRSGFPFSTYGETSFIMVQNVVIAVLVLQYGGKTGAAALFVGGLATAGAALFNPTMIDSKTLSILMSGAGALSIASKLPQIVTNYSQGGTGQLSAFAVFNYLFGSLSRIFTTLQEVDDKLILYGFIAGFILNAILAAQMVYYWNAPTVKSKGKQRESPVAASTSASAGSSTGTPKGKSPTSRRRG